MKYFDYALWIDDTKNVANQLYDISKEVIICRTVRQAISALSRIYVNPENSRTESPKVLICIDYNLGLNKTGTGLDIAKYIVDNNMPITCYVIISIYPIGRELIQNLLSQYYIYEESIESAYKTYINKQENEPSLLDRIKKWFKKLHLT